MPEKDPKKVALGKRIRELREQAGLSREQLAPVAGVSVRAIVQWELGEREPGWFNITAICNALGIDCTAFTTTAADREPPGRGRPRKTPAAVSAASGTAEEVKAAAVAPKASTRPKKSMRKGQGGK